MYSLLVQGQDFTFSQFYEMPLLRNPAIAGIFSGDIRLNSAYRSQWGSVTVPYNTYAVSSELKFPVAGDDYFTASLLVTNDVAGDSRLSRLQLFPAVNYLMSVNGDNGYLALGFMGGFVQSRFDPTRLTFDDQFINGSFNPGNATSQTFTKTGESHADMAIGASYSNLIGYSTKYYLGFSYFHINKPNVSFTNEVFRIKSRAGVNAGVRFSTSEIDEFSLYGDVLFQGGNRQYLAGALFSHILGDYLEDDRTALHFGLAYRWSDALIPVIKLEIHNINFGLSYDINISKLTAASKLRGGFELTMAYRNFLNIRNSSRDKIKCPVGF